jgi:phenylacetic acid degradation protein PaaD
MAARKPQKTHPANRDRKRGADPNSPRRAIDGLKPDDHAVRALGIRLERLRDGAATMSMTVTEAMSNGLGICHGGIIFTLADTAMAYASNSRGVPAVAATASINFVRPARTGDRLVARTVERHLSRRTALYEVDVTRGDGAIIATFHGRVMFLADDSEKTGPSR